MGKKWRDLLEHQPIQLNALSWTTGTIFGGKAEIKIQILNKITLLFPILYNVCLPCFFPRGESWNREQKLTAVQLCAVFTNSLWNSSSIPHYYNSQAHLTELCNPGLGVRREKMTPWVHPVYKPAWGTAQFWKVLCHFCKESLQKG